MSIHRADCPNVRHAVDFENRMIEVEWEDTAVMNMEFDVDLEIHGFNRNGLLNDILQTVNSMTKQLSSVEARSNKEKTATIRLTLRIQNLNHLKSIVDKIKQIPDVYSVRRMKG